MNEWVAIDCRKDRPEIQVKGEIVPDELSRCTLKREMRAILPYPGDVAANDTIPGPIVNAVPAEDLAAGKGLVQRERLVRERVMTGMGF